MLKFTESNSGEQAQIKAGETFEISLHENPTTGFRWKLAGGTEPVCTLTADHFQPGSAPGAEGIHSWRFVGAQAGETTVRMSLGRSWTQGAQPPTAFSLAVRVT